MRETAELFKVGDHVTYTGKTYTFPGIVSAVCHDGQIVVEAHGSEGGHYRGMKHIYAPSQLRLADTGLKHRVRTKVPEGSYETLHHKKCWQPVTLTPEQSRHLSGVFCPRCKTHRPRAEFDWVNVRVG